MKTLFASCVSVVSIIVQREVEPWLKDRTDIVANAGLWLVFAWLFALNSYGSLSRLPGVVWGTPLVLVTIAFVAIVIQQSYAERKEAQAALRGEVVERRRRSTRRRACSIRPSRILVIGDYGSGPLDNIAGGAPIARREHGAKRCPANRREPRVEARERCPKDGR